MKDASRRLRELIDAEGWDKAEAAERLGISPYVLYAWTCGKREPGHDRLEAALSRAGWEIPEWRRRESERTE